LAARRPQPAQLDIQVMAVRQTGEGIALRCYIGLRMAKAIPQGK
jgi:hypothetical protein